MGQETVPGVILAGGQGRRMGCDKAFAALAGRPLIDHVVGRMAPQAAPLAVNANGDPARFGELELTVIADAPGLVGMGPLAGILAALDWAATLGAARVVTVPVDTPFLPRDLVRRLAQVEAPIALAETADGLHGTCGLWSVGLRDDLQAALRDGQRKVTAFTARQGAVAVRFDDHAPPPFFNVNRPEDLARAERWLA